MIETHYKTRIVSVSFVITVSGWWAWNAFLSGAYSSNLSPYDIKHGFTNGFGKDPVWWLVLVLTLAVLFTIELVWKSLRRNLAVAGRWPPWKLKSEQSEKNAEDLDLEIWQESQREAGVRENLRKIAHGEGVGADEENFSEHGFT